MFEEYKLDAPHYIISSSRHSSLADQSHGVFLLLLFVFFCLEAQWPGRWLGLRGPCKL
jgi:hypothetical protein